MFEERKGKRGIEPVIATVIIVSVAIAISVAVAFWMTGITGLFTKYERVEVTNAYAEWYEDYNCWLVVLQLRNSGSDDATLDEIFINGRPHDAWTGLNDRNYGYFNEKVAPELVTNIDYPSVSFSTNDHAYVKNGSNVYIVAINSTSSSNKEFAVQFDYTNGVPLPAGEDMTIVIIMAGPGFKGSDTAVDFKHGASIEVKIHTAAGKEYPKAVVLP